MWSFEELIERTEGTENKQKKKTEKNIRIQLPFYHYILAYFLTIFIIISINVVMRVLFGFMLSGMALLPALFVVYFSRELPEKTPKNKQLRKFYAVVAKYSVYCYAGLLVASIIIRFLGY